MKPATKAIHAGAFQDASGAVNNPIVHSTTYHFPEFQGASNPYIYTRYANPTVQALEAKMGALEGGVAYAFASGMGAISALCSTLLKPGQTIAILHGIYGGTTAYLEDHMEPMGVNIVAFAAGEPLPPCDVAWLESITNPMLQTPDIAAYAAQAKTQGATLVVDATFATPLLQQPLAMGADFVVHSATKYLCGHSDVTAGFVIAPEESKAVWTSRRNLGATLDPLAASLLDRGLKTLPIRLREACNNAKEIATRLRHAGYTVHYPEMGAMVTVDVGSKAAAIHVRQHVKLIAPAASLGGVETLLSLPIEASHAYCTQEIRDRDGITDGLVRISVGIEDIEDLWADLQQALA